MKQKSHINICVQAAMFRAKVFFLQTRRRDIFCNPIPTLHIRLLSDKPLGVNRLRLAASFKLECEIPLQLFAAKLTNQKKRRKREGQIDLRIE